jgi:hypothetical protein
MNNHANSMIIIVMIIITDDVVECLHEVAWIVDEDLICCVCTAPPIDIDDCAHISSSVGDIRGF